MDEISQPDVPRPAGWSRRRLVRAGAAALPIILTLHARPALAQGGDGSGNVSGLPGYGKPGKWNRGADGHWHWEGFIDPNTGQWNGKGESPDSPPPEDHDDHGHGPPPGHHGG